MTVTTEEVEKVWAEADCLWSEQQVERAIDELAQKIEVELRDKNPLVLSVMKGGLVFTSKLMMRLSFPLELDYVHASRYGMELNGNQLHWKVRPEESLAGRVVLVVDDILDVGQTLKAIVESCQEQQAEAVYTAVLVDKKHARKADPNFKADFSALEVEDRYVFGYGMDYKGYLRNAAGIYAVKGA